MDKYKTYRVPNWTNLEMTPDKGQMVLQYMRERCLENQTTGVTVVAYTHGATCLGNAYYGGVLAPNGRVYLIPFGQSTATVWHYIDTDGTVVPYTHGATCVSSAYIGGVLAPNGKIYLIPNNQSTATVWHYIDTDGTVVPYTHGATCVATAYSGGVLAPNGRIYLAPLLQYTSTVWHYIDTNNGTVIPYTHGVVSATRCSGAVLAPNGRIYLIPVNDITRNFLYIDTNGSVVSYTHAYNPAAVYQSAIGYDGNIYCSNEPSYINPITSVMTKLNGVSKSEIGSVSAGNRVYLVPYDQATDTTWRYIDVNSKTIVDYSHMSSVGVKGAYRSGVLTPNGRIYLIPYGQSTATVWHYIDTGLLFSNNLLTSPYFDKL